MGRRPFFVAVCSTADLTQFFAAIALRDEQAMDSDCAVCPGARTRSKDALEGFIANRLQPIAYRREGTVAHSVNILQGLEAVDVWYRVKFAVPDVQVDTEHTVLHRRPKGTRGIGELDGRFDTVLVNDSEGEGVETGIEGASPRSTSISIDEAYNCLIGKRAGCILHSR